MDKLKRHTGVTYAKIAGIMGISKDILAKRLKKGLSIEDREMFQFAAVDLFNEMMAVHGMRIRLKHNKIKEVANENI